MKKMLLTAAVFLFAANLSANSAVETQQVEENNLIAQNEQGMGKQQMQGQGMNQGQGMGQQGMGGQQMMGNCQNMSQDEQSFASQLSASNKNTFCSQFTPAQRRSAMQMSGTTGPNGMKMTPDQAVEQVSRSGTRMGGGCPVR